MYPLGKDRLVYERLVKVLMLYRLTLGQPRQGELLGNLGTAGLDGDTLTDELSEDGTLHVGVFFYSLWNGYRVGEQQSAFEVFRAEFGIEIAEAHSDRHADAGTLSLLFECPHALSDPGCHLVLRYGNYYMVSVKGQ